MTDTRLQLFNKILHHLPWEERKNIIAKLKKLNISDSETLSYKKGNLMFSIYHAVRRTPLMEISFPSMMTGQDKKDFHFSSQIMLGINGYLDASLKKQEALQKNLLTCRNPKNILAYSHSLSMNLIKKLHKYFSR